MNGLDRVWFWHRQQRRRRRVWREERIDRMIDALNEERRPPDPAEEEEAELLAVARMLKALRGVPEPAEGWQPAVMAGGRRSSGGITAERGAAFRAGLPETRAASHPEGRASNLWRRRIWIPAAVLAVVGMALATVLTPWPGIPALRGALWGQRGPARGTQADVVHAMERAVAGLKSYHAVMEKRVLNAAGEEWRVRRVEIWVDGNRYASRDDTGVLTVHDGRRKWQVQPSERMVVMLPALPDPRSFDLRDDAQAALRYPHQVVGREQVAQREAVRLRIQPPGGLPYDLWVDAETSLPVRLRTAMQNGLQTDTTFVQLEANVPVEPDRFDFRVPPGYRVEEENPGQLVDTPTEAEAIAGLTPLVPATPPQRLLAAPGRIVLDYGETVMVEEPARGPFRPEPNAALGSVGQEPLEVVGERLRWRQQGLEITVEGPQRVELARSLAPNLQLPDPSRGPGFDPQVEVAVDLEVERNSQAQVDGGHSPWMLDPVQVAGAFLLGRFGQQMGDPAALVDQHIRVVQNDGKRAVVEVDVGPVERVYLQRLVRQDETGIWTVVGYDPRVP